MAWLPKKHGPTQQQRRRLNDQQRGSAARRGYDRQWRKYSERYLQEHPLCVDPFDRHGPRVPAQCTDHIKPPCGDEELFWDPTNHQALCLDCNTVKAIKFEGGFGNAKREYR